MDFNNSNSNSNSSNNNNNSNTRLGAKGLIRKHELVRLIIQTLYSLGYTASASCLESESGVRHTSLEFDSIASHVSRGNWEGCVDAIQRIEGLEEEDKASALFLVFKQCLLECLRGGDDCSALSVLRRRVVPSRLGKENVGVLARSLVLNEGVCESRERLVVRLGELMPPPIVLSENRLERLIESVVEAQVDSCLYHNSLGPVSICVDHCCGRDQIPTETVQILTEHTNEVWFVQFSNNGEYLASSSIDFTAIIWKVMDDGFLKAKHTLRGHQKPVSYLAWSPNDMKLLTCGNMEVAKLWDLETGTCKHTFGDNGFIVSSCAWFPDSQRLVCGSSDPEKGICLWDCDGNEIKVWRGMRMPKVLDLAVTPDGENLISVLSDKEIRIVNLQTYTERQILEQFPITSLSVSADSNFFMVNLNSQEIHLWDVAGRLESPLKYTGHKQRLYVIRSCFGGLNSSFIASGSEDSQVFIWNRSSTKPIEVLSGHLMTVNSVSWNPKRHQMLASASDDHTIRIWGPSQSKITQHDQHI